ncbi:hypothetical protein [Chitinophaga filiformis]|uniref:Uncharacterized protein n=1 Tax=Chitinophaga filiformis TaxID=104663 RepID=A0ABY4I5Q4_CHIFI|nr:hypothetical protein [Chitinophaga filiformis]UPK70963.1 hypothetical protein MYF79_06575 [Chitinophaga filiformis]
MHPEWYGKNYGSTHFGIARKNKTFYVREYNPDETIPGDIILPQPLHDNIADRMKPSVFYPKNTIKFEWKASWGYYEFHYLTIYYKEIPVQFINIATPEIVLQYLLEYVEIDEIEVLRRQVMFLQNKLHKTEVSLTEYKTKFQTVDKLHKELLNSLKNNTYFK